MGEQAPSAGTATKATLGLTGLTINAMALIAPGAFLWLTYAMQSQYGAPLAGQDMWMGIVFALLLCFATAISYAELSKLYPGAGSSYFFAEQAFLGKTTHYRYARVAKFIVGWASHLYYWVYPGVMVAVTAIVVSYMLGQIWPATFSVALPSMLFMILFSIAFAYAVSYIAYRGVVGTTSVNMAVNVIQITALMIFAVIAIAYRVKHPDGSQGYTMDPSNVPTAVMWETEKDKDGNVLPKKLKDEKGNETGGYSLMKGVDGKDKPILLSYAPDQAVTTTTDPATNVKTTSFQFHATGGSVTAPHQFSYILIQACIAILILVGFESVTSMGEEAKNPKKDIPKAIILSLAIQGGVCYLIEYYAANVFLNSGYTMTTAAGSPAPVGDMMYIVGTWLFGSASAGKAFMMIQAVTVFLALIGTTLACITTGARVTYAMGRDEEVPSHFGLLHGKYLSPHRAIWALATISAVIGVICCIGAYWGPGAPSDDVIKGLPKNIWYSFGVPKTNAGAAALPNSLLFMTLVSNFGTFMLYGLTCITAMIAFKDHHTFREVKHSVVPMFGVVANVACMLFYLIGPFSVDGMSWKESYIALGIAFVWGIYGLRYFFKSSRYKGKPVFLDVPSGSGAGAAMPVVLTSSQGSVLATGNGGEGTPHAAAK